MQDNEATQYLKLLSVKGKIATIKALTQYDTGEYYDVMETFKDDLGNNDNYFEYQDYVLVWNYKYNYIGLYRKLDIVK
jgi:hypothetical protein